MTDAILALNAGSSSIKFSLFDASPGAQDPTLIYRGQIEGIGRRPHFYVRDGAGAEVLSQRAPEASSHRGALFALREWLRLEAATWRIVAAGHRVVHGGRDYAAPVLLDERVLERLERIVPLAPLHQTHNIAAIRALEELDPGLPQVACFDTAFHQTQPAVARTFALPRELTEAGVVRYGFHGLSYEYIAGVLPRYVGDGADGRVVVAHLGHGASMCALEGRRSVATTMGFTALDGLPMASRCGALDPGVILYLMAERGMDLAAVTDLLYYRSGLLGLSGISGDMRDLLASPDPRAAQAVRLFVYRICRELGSLAAALGGLDVLVFSGGIGEHAAPVRAQVCEGSRWLGVSLDEAANEAHGPRITSADSPVSAWVIPTDEELMIVRHTREVLR